GVLWLLYREAAAAPPDQRAQLRIDAIKTAVTLFAGTAGVTAVVLTLRNHFTGEVDRLNRQFMEGAEKLASNDHEVSTAAYVNLLRLAQKHRAYRSGVDRVIWSHQNGL